MPGQELGQIIVHQGKYSNMTLRDAIKGGYLFEDAVDQILDTVAKQLPKACECPVRPIDA